MAKSVAGIYRDGKIELLEPLDQPEGTPVVVSVQPDRIDLSERGIGEAQAADLRARLRSFAEDWLRPEMDAYDRL